LATSCIVQRNKLATCTHVKVTAKGKPSGTATTTIVTCTTLFSWEKLLQKIKEEKNNVFNISYKSHLQQW